MTSTSKAFILAPFVMAGLAACSGPKHSELTALQQKQVCQGKVDTVGFPETTAAKYIDGREGVYKLTNLNVYQETSTGEAVAYFAGRATIPVESDPEAAPAATPAPTPTPTADSAAAPAADPTTKPGFQQIVTKNEIVCFNTDAMAEGELQADIEAPLSISPVDGKIAKELPYKVVAQFKRLGEKASATEKSDAKSSTDVSSSELSPIAGCATEGSGCKLFNTGKKSFAMRIEKTEGDTKKVLVAIYRLSALPKREAKKQEPVQPQPQPQPANPAQP